MTRDQLKIMSELLKINNLCLSISSDNELEILKNIKERYENHHNVNYTDDALNACVDLTDRYMLDRFLPDKAIDLIDEAASRLRMEIDSKPEEVDELNRRVIQLKIEKEALKKENDEASIERLKSSVNSFKIEMSTEDWFSLLEARNGFKIP